MARPPNTEADMLQRLQRHAEAISRNGSLAIRREPGRTPATVLRFRDTSHDTSEVRQYSISLGQNEKLITAVTALITERLEKRTQLQQEKKEQKLLRRTQRLREYILRHQIGNSRRYRQRAVSEYRKMDQRGAAPCLAMFFDMLEGGLVKRPKRGRPFANRLW